MGRAPVKSASPSRELLMVLVPNIRILDFLIHDIGPTLLTLFRCSMSRMGAGSQI
jgi:hypothetical protein